MIRIVHGERVLGVSVDDQTRCAHYRSDLDVIAIRFKCCDRWYPCYECHDECEEHESRTWPHNEFSTKAVLCGVCGNQLSIEEYLNSDSKCPSCRSNFNPGCAKHYHLYFEVGDQA